MRLRVDGNLSIHHLDMSSRDTIVPQPAKHHTPAASASSRGAAAQCRDLIAASGQPSTRIAKSHVFCPQIERQLILKYQFRYSVLSILFHDK